MKKIKVSDLKVGVKFSKPVFLDADNVFLKEYTPITDADIARLKKFGFKEVLTSGDAIGDEVDASSYSASNSDNIELEKVDLTGSFIDTSELVRRAYEDAVRKLPDFKAKFREAHNTIQTFYRKVYDKKPVDFFPIRDVAENLVNLVKDIPNIPLLMLQNELEGYYLYNHVLYSTIYSILLGNALELNRPRLIDLACGGLLADIGMVKVPSEISEKKEPLTEDESKIIKQHPIIGFHILTNILKIKKSLATIALQHHENYDGSGYPQKLKTIAIDELTRIHTIADHFSALILDRPWRKAKLPHEALKSMISANVNKFDLKYIKVFINKLSIYPIGSYVELSDGHTAVVVDANDTKPLRPSILLVKDKQGSLLRPSKFINLSEENDMVITKAVIFNQQNG